MGGTLRLLLAVMLAGLFLTMASPASAAMRWGINPGMAGAEDHVDSAYGEAAVSQMAAIGLREARYPAPWFIADPDGSAVKPGGSFVFHTYFDRVATVLAEHGIRWNPVFLYPPWIYSADPSGIGGANPTRESHPHFASFVGAFAERYGEDGSFWSEHPDLEALPVTDYEIWNEPNLPGVWANAEAAPREYMDLYAVSYDAIKHVDPGARVMFGSFTPSPDAWNESAFLAAAVAHRPGQPIDEVGYHPNTVGIGTHGPVEHVYRLLRPFRAQMDSLGMQSVPISITELAWGSEYSIFTDSLVTLTEADRARAMTVVGTALANSDCNVNMVAMLFWGTDRVVTSATEDPQRYLPSVFALAGPDNSIKPIGEAYRDVIAAEPSLKPAAICRPGDAPPQTRTTTSPDSGPAASAVELPAWGGLLAGDVRSAARQLRGKRLGRRGLTLRGLRAPAAGRYTATLRVRGRAGAVLATGARRAGRPGRYTLRLRPTRKGRRLSAARSTARATLTIAFRDRGGRIARERASVSLGTRRG